MPELPEVETIKNDLSAEILHKKILFIELRLKKIVKNDPSFFKKVLIGAKFRALERCGKLMIFSLGNGQFLLIHLKMTGQLIFRNKKQVIAGGHSDTVFNFDLPNKYSHLVFVFEDKSKLFFNDLRQFGYARIVDKNQLEQIKQRFGMDPLDSRFTLKYFRNLLKKRTGNLKAFLLNQSIIAGLGNIYADEILFEAKILPMRKVTNLTIGEISLLHKSIRKIIMKAIKYRGTTFNTYVDSAGRRGDFLKFLRVYKKEKKLCQRCAHVIKKIKVAGRGTRFCEYCQK
ncbi:MAG: formamidopyrimidine-DNA glycosylase, formamidopyrimidine-DNA glycosylase [Candidatus Peregrinibacteria bacterium GW2011_GWF2_39_17]|nr:MAG: formamidopyrimidine-DNA glycosylase, formamidopyrimidine-DNA glycosylase [Candidatus Peregrinibacteria bacterium GW2011_GWF2_39_17]HCW32312.1 DNA-formamidopyrimidine glycosylase [Candidatus Peregrinibacteria bacterium]